MMKKFAYLPVLLTMLVLFSCGKSSLHNLNVQVPPEKQQVEVTVSSLDLRAGTPTTAQVVSACRAADADLLLIRTPGTIDGNALATWFSANASQWGHLYSYVVLSAGKGLVATARSAFFAEKLPLTASDDALIVESRGMGYVLCDAAGDDLRTLADDYRQGERRLNGWVVFPAGLSDVLEEASFVDCLAAQWGHRMPAGSPVLYASAGVWDRMGTITTAPLSFVITVSQE